MVPKLRTAPLSSASAVSSSTPPGAAVRDVQVSLLERAVKSSRFVQRSLACLRARCQPVKLRPVTSNGTAVGRLQRLCRCHRDVCPCLNGCKCDRRKKGVRPQHGRMDPSARYEHPPTAFLTRPRATVVFTLVF